ncbi:CLUMA_CG007404, isoform A [Clunio marinus]|uniref:CLUMA_CG007404, isoform A n=1 Tax=Clunio marinus TaxID=568069 RepID=A0A1J1I0S8_9DIPT|nr:CLUMA_CG007404, isoform A [Clunio marinus]
MNQPHMLCSSFTDKHRPIDEKQVKRSYICTNMEIQTTTYPWLQRHGATVCFRLDDTMAIKDS